MCAIVVPVSFSLNERGFLSLCHFEESSVKEGVTSAIREATSKGVRIRDFGGGKVTR